MKHAHIISRYTWLAICVTGCVKKNLEEPPLNQIAPVCRCMALLGFTLMSVLRPNDCSNNIPQSQAARLSSRQCLQMEYLHWQQHQAETYILKEQAHIFAQKLHQILWVYFYPNISTQGPCSHETQPWPSFTSALWQIKQTRNVYQHYSNFGKQWATVCPLWLWKGSFHKTMTWN